MADKIKDLPFLRFLFKSDTDTPQIDYRTGQKEKDTWQSANPSPSSLYARSGYPELQQAMKVSQKLLERYRDYEDMDDDPIISSAYDIYADDVTQMDYRTRYVMWAESPKVSVVDEIMGVLHNKINIEENAWEIARTLAKYGNDFEAIKYSPKGVEGLDFIAPAMIRRYEHQGKAAFASDLEGKFNYSDKEVFDLIKKNVRRDESTIFLENWEMVHMRLRTKNRGSRYGYGVAEAARWAWKRLQLLEESSVIHKASRAANRLAYYVYVGNVDDVQARKKIKDLQREYRKKSFIDPSTGKLSFKNSPLAADEDIWIPLKSQKDPTRIEPFPMVDTQDLEPLRYFRDKEFAGIKVPKRFLSYGEGAMDVMRSTSHDEIRFARGVLRLQRQIIQGINKVVGVHYALQGKDYREMDYVIKMTVPSTAFEIAQLEVENIKVSLASQMMEFVSKEWILTRILGIPESDVQIVLRQRNKEMKDEAKAQADALAGLPPEMQQAAGFESKNFKDTAQYARQERKWDKQLNEIKDIELLNSGGIEELRKVLNEIVHFTKGIKFTTPNNGERRYSFGSDFSYEEVNPKDFFTD